MTNFDLERRTNLPQADCVNCGQRFEGFFCPKCGQRKLEGRFTLKESSGWIFDKIFNLERGALFTIKELFVNPGEMIRAYLKRATVRYMHPFRFVFLMATISALITILSGAFESAAMMQGLDESFEGLKDGTSSDNTEIQSGIMVLETIKKYLAFILLANIPFNALASFLIYFRKKFNYTEHLILNCYMYGFSLVVGLPTFLLLLLDDGMMIYSGVSSLVYVISNAYIFSKLFKEHILEGFVKALAQFIITMIIGVILIAVIVLIGLLVKESLA